MSKTRIEWCDFSVNPVKGLCPVACSYCYARRMYKRFGWNPEIRYDDMVWQAGSPMPKGSRIFVGSTIDLFHEKTIHCLPTIMEYVEAVQSRTFIFLTKCPHNLPKKWPDNCWVGVSVTKKIELYPAIYALADIKCGKRFLSFEPLLENVLDRILPAEWDDAIDWVIIGQQTPVKMSTMPQLGWVEDIVKAADANHIKVFLKDNLISCVDQYGFALKDGKYRQEFPEHREVRRNNSDNGKRGVPCGKNGGNAPTSPTLQVKGLSPDQKPLVNNEDCDCYECNDRRVV